ncbi:MAG: hypothetical protein IJM15_04030 [Erysipelotrichaceae bacterium]|nr:hypothetical protein [Erysipelotrichaceae bacterium]
MPVKEPKAIRIQKYITILNCSYAEAKEMVEDDDLIDAGGICRWETNLTPEQLSLCRQYRRQPLNGNRRTKTPYHAECVDPHSIQNERSQAVSMNRSRTSTAVKRKYNERVYTMLAAQLPKQLVADFKQKCRSEGISQASVIRNAIEAFVN